MQGVGRHTLYIVGDRQVGKTSIISRLFQNCNLVYASVTDEATEYHVHTQGRELKILEIRNYTFLIENAIECDEQRDIVFFCYAINDPDSYKHAFDFWIPYFEEFSGMYMVLIGNKKELRNNHEVIRILAEWELQPVSTDQGSELFNFYDSLDIFVELSIYDTELVEDLLLLINGTLIRCSLEFEIYNE